MKIKLLAPAIFFYIILAGSCQKEKIPGIVGEWLNTAIYSGKDQGDMDRIEVLKFPQRLSLDNNSRFQSFTDIPEGSGTYQFNKNSGELRLNYEPGFYGSGTGVSILKVEYLGGDKMVTIKTISNGTIEKKEYTRID